MWAKLHYSLLKNDALHKNKEAKKNKIIHFYVHFVFCMHVTIFVEDVVF